MKEGLLLLDQVRRTGGLDMGMMEMPQFFEPAVSNAETNTLPWSEFKYRLNPLGSLNLPGTFTECIVSPKYVGWSVEDVNTYVGSEKRTINEIDDLTDNEGVQWLMLNFNLARGLLGQQRSQTQVNIGFNPQEFSVGHHTVARLHSHIRGIGHDIDNDRRQQMDWKDFDWFDRLGFIEPFSIIHHDYISRYVREGNLEESLVGPPKEELGYTSLYMENAADLPLIFPQLKRLYSSMKQEYERLESIFTDKVVDASTGRYLPRNSADRIERLDDYLSIRGDWLSKRSHALLTYLAENIRTADNRDLPRDISSAETMYITKGFAGAMTFEFNLDSDLVRFDFLPRVITTTGVTKTISGKDKATIIAKEKSPAQEEEREIAGQYHWEIDSILQNRYPGIYSSRNDCSASR